MFKQIEVLQKEVKELKAINDKHKSINSELLSTKNEIDYAIKLNKEIEYFEKI